MLKLANNATSKLSANISTISTSLSVLPGDGAKFPTLGAGEWFPLTIVKSDGTLEIVKCTARSSDTFTIQRAQEGTAATAFNSGDRVELRLTSAAVEEIRRTTGADYAGATAPTTTWAYMKWADTANSLLKRRNAANTDWVVEGTLFKASLPQYALADIPTTDKGPIYVIGLGPMEWDGSSYRTPEAYKWLSTPIGVLIPIRDDLAGVDIPPTNNNQFRFIKLTASDAYNTGILVSETVTGSAPLVVATAVISLTGSPINGATVNLINTERRSLRAGSSGTVQNDSMQQISAAINMRRLSDGNSLAASPTGAFSFSGGSGPAGARLSADAQGADLSLDVLSFSTAGVVRSDNETRSKNIGVTYYMRVK